MKQLLLSLLIFLIIGQYENVNSHDIKGSDEFGKSDLPIILMPASVINDLPLVFFISGDGGWKSWNQNVSEELAKKGMPVVDLNAQKYFWNEKTPQKVADELIVLIKQYMQTWNKSTFILLGYSFGACVAPFIANNFEDH